MFEEIISKFCNESKFVNDFNGLVQYLDGLHLSYEEKSEILEEIFLYNSKMYSLLVEENKKLEKIIARVNVSKERKNLPIVESKIKSDAENLEVINIDVNVYLNKVKQCTNLEELKYLLPNNKTNNIIIVLKLVEEMLDIKKMLYQDRHNIDNNTKLYFENEIEKLKIKIEYIKQIINKVQNKNIDNVVKPENKLVFLKTNYGNVCAYSDLKDIPSDSYDLFLGLLESIRLGTFKNMKVISGVDNIKDFSEVKDGQARIIYDRIGKDTYVIISMFIKKVLNAAAYRASLVNRSDLYIQNKDIIVPLALSNEEFLEENQQIRNKVYSILKKENSVKKKGEIDG